jgi:hypothetical protein
MNDLDTLVQAAKQTLTLPGRALDWKTPRRAIWARAGA